MKFSDQVRSLQLLVALQAIAVLALLLGTGLSWNNGDLLALICVTVGSIFSGLLLLSTRCPKCQDFFFVESEAEMRTKKGMLKGFTTRGCQKCGHPLVEPVAPASTGK